MIFPVLIYILYTVFILCVLTIGITSLCLKIILWTWELQMERICITCEICSIHICIGYIRGVYSLSERVYIGQVSYIHGRMKNIIPYKILWIYHCSSVWYCICSVSVLYGYHMKTVKTNFCLPLMHLQCSTCMDVSHGSVQMN